MRLNSWTAVLLVTILAWITGPLAARAFAADVSLRVDTQQPAHAISPRLYGIFFEDINFGGDGGLSAELVKNGSFEFPQGLMGWSSGNDGAERANVQIADSEPAFAANPHYLRLVATSADETLQIANEGFRGIGVRAGERYTFSLTARANGTTPAGLRVLLVSPDGKSLAAADVAGIGGEWSEHKAVLTPTETAANAKLVLAPTAAGTIDLDMVSLVPENTWKKRPHGLRNDLVQKLADLKPAFLRFPGGCIVEGDKLDRRYQWKTTIGDQEERKLIVNRWNYEFAHRRAPDYYQSFGVGFFEYFQLAEDIGAEPLPILNCGMACQFNSGELAPLDEMGPYIQDALDLIEFANGAVTTRWGARRAAMGHPEPFNMKLLGVGNEQWDQQYFDRYALFAKTLKEKHPEIKIVSSAGPFPADARFKFAWPLLRGMKADIVDEHSYAMPDWFLREATRYDDYDRQGPKVFMGEYAAQSTDICAPDNRNDLRCALAEAAFMTGLERNSDVVVMSSYAPLFGHEDAWQWRPNLIWFDNLMSYATPNYYVQQLFSRNRGDVVLPVELIDSRPPRPAMGGIGLVTTGASAEFKDVRVTRDGETLYDGESLADPAKLTRFRGNWQAEQGVLRQANDRDAARIHFGDPKWQDYTLTLKARKLAGREGLGVIVRNSDGGSYLQWNLGSGGNKQHWLEAHLATHSTDDTTVDRKDGSLEIGRWYDVKVELQGNQVRCYLDGELVQEAEISPPNISRLFATASRDDATGQVILKVVNPTDDATSVSVDLGGFNLGSDTARAIVLSGKPDDVNSIAEPGKVVPQEKSMAITGSHYEATFEPHSLTILRFDGK
jgi:alpha-N-arabinofuranosidase